MDDLQAQLMVQMLLEEEQEVEEDEDKVQQAVATGILVYGGVEESSCLHSERCSSQWAYLTQPELLPNPQESSPWQSLYASQSD